MVYNPGRSGNLLSVDDLRQFVVEEFEKISKEFNEQIAVDLRKVYREPERPRDGMIVSADGTSWNPGQGAGVYERVNGVWRRQAGLTDGDYGDVTVSGSGTVVTIDNNVVSLAKLVDIATARILGRITAGTGDPETLTGTQVTTLLDVFTSALKGLVPASGGGTTNFLRADGSFAVPPSGGVAPQSVVTASSGTTVTISSIPSWDILIFAIAALSHNGTGGANQTLTIETSTNNGSSWSTAVGITVGAQAAATSSSGLIALFSTSSGQVVGGNVGSQTANGITNSTGAVNAVRFSWSLGGSFDDANGTITPYVLT